jgi:ABC-type glutathione transport system ATPase component
LSKWWAVWETDQKCVQLVVFLRLGLRPGVRLCSRKNVELCCLHLESLKMLEVLNLSVSYPSKRTEALCSLSFRLPKGGVLGLTGASGSGKSTFAAAFFRLLPIGTKLLGKVFWGGVDILQENEREFRKRLGAEFGYVMQDAIGALNPALPIRRHFQLVQKLFSVDPSKVVRQLSQVGLDGSVLDSYPSELSGGMAQRVLIALVMIRNPQLVILDEPTSALDSASSDLIAQLLLRPESANVTWVVISHDIAFLSRVGAVVQHLDTSREIR